jgi:hypothetical protein
MLGLLAQAMGETTWLCCWFAPQLQTMLAIASSERID